MRHMGQLVTHATHMSVEIHEFEFFNFLGQCLMTCNSYPKNPAALY